MFTGLVEEMGSIDSIHLEDGAATIRVACQTVHSDVEMGASVAINGCCLTVVAFADNKLTFEAGAETLHRTNLGDLTTGSPVNLERSLAVGQRMGGHYVSGHIDGLATVVERSNNGPWAKFWFEIDPDLTRQMASKGSVAVDGVSLTLVDVTHNRFSVELIPHTLDVTTIGTRQVGDHVNIETDLLAKYVQQQLDRQN
ncbi:MAG: riboflavin synthase [Planctomycetota bacterium]